MAAVLTPPCSRARRRRWRCRPTAAVRTRYSGARHAIPRSGAITAGAACFGAYIGYRGLERWRAETIGKRKAELAEEVLADFYEAREIIQAARMPGSLSNEGDSRAKSPDETEADTRTLNAYFSVAERLSKKTEFFAQVESRRYRFIAHFGLPAAEPYMTLRKIHGEILVNVRMLLMTHRQRQLGANPTSIEHWQKTIWEMSEND